MANIRIGWVNRSDAATLSGGDWEPTLPLANLQTRFGTEVARATSADEADTVIDVDFGSTPRGVREVVLTNHNISVAGYVTISAGTTLGGTDVLDGSPVAVWDTTPTRDLLWEDPNWWTGQKSTDEVEGYPLPFFYDCGANLTARYWRIAISDENNGAGYVQIGRLWMGPVWSPERNAQYGARLRWEPQATEQRTDSGVLYFDEKPPIRAFAFSLTVSDDEAFGTLLDLGRIAGNSRDVIVRPDADDLARGYKRNIRGRLREADWLEQAYFGFQKTAYVIEEWR